MIKIIPIGASNKSVYSWYGRMALNWNSRIATTPPVVLPTKRESANLKVCSWSVLRLKMADSAASIGEPRCNTLNSTTQRNTDIAVFKVRSPI